jgi:hypothetical protein
MECKARQILIKVYNDEGIAYLTKSLSEIIAKVNKAIDATEDAVRPKDMKVESACKIKQRAILLTLNSREAMKWITEAENEMAFTKVFIESSHIQDRQYNPVVPEVPLTFKPSKPRQLQELEEANNL